MSVNKIDTLIFDLNGTLYEKGVPVEGAIETLNELRQRNYHLNFVTNTDGRSAKRVLSRIRDKGFDIREEELLTPVSAAKTFIKNNSDQSYYLLVYDEVKDDLSEAKINEQKPDYVVIGDFSDKMSYGELNKVFRLIDNGAQVISLSNTTWYLSKHGKNINTGAFVEMFENLCNVKATLLGKPSVDFFMMALNRTESSPETTMVIGDDLLTDIYGGNAIGATTVQVRTGVYNRESNSNTGIEPNYTIDSVKNILDLIE